MGQDRQDGRGKKAKSKEVEVKRLPEKVLGIENMLMALKKKYKESRAVHHQIGIFLQRSCIFYLFFLLYTQPSLCFFIDNSKYFPGRQLSVMIWTAASAISASAAS